MKLLAGTSKDVQILYCASLTGWQFEKITGRIPIDYTAKGEIEYHKSKFRPGNTVYIDDGLIYNDRKSSDRGVVVVYDRKNKRLYFYATLR